MATTESRTGFRLPWSTDRAPSGDGFEATSGNDPSASPDGPDESDRDTAIAASTLDTGAPSEADAAEGVTAVTDPPVEWAPVPVEGAAGSVPTTRHTTDSPVAQHPGPARRPTKFLTDLTHAMQVAAEQARAATLEQFRVDGSAYVEQIQGRSVADASALRRHADDDVASIKDWSKVEIARIREETDTRITGRRGQLDDQLARHRALVERDVARIEGQIASFEAEMAAFFDELLAETDLTLLAARAQQMPEAPTFDEPDESAFTALMTEPAVGIPAAAPIAEPEPVVEIASEPAVEMAATIEPDPMSGLVATSVDDDAVTPSAETPTDDPAFDREAAMAAIQAAAEAAASLEAETIASDGTGEDVQTVAAATADADVATDAADAATDAADTSMTAWSTRDSDPRLAMLGLTPDFAAAELAAVEAAAAELQEIPEMDEQDLTARLAGLVPSAASAAAPAEAGPSMPMVSTQVIVSGLVSVASIASFKRHLSRATGVRHVGVSSGPDGEFLFTVQHGTEVVLRDLIPTLPGFQARVTGGSSGIVTASAHDPED
jgi:hypothetical protein